MSFYPQPYTYQCGPFALKYALVMLGKMEDESLIEKKAGSTWWYGTDEIGLAKAAKFFECELDEFVPSDPDKAIIKLNKFLTNEIPCMLCVDKWSHWITVVSVENDRVLGDRYVCVDSGMKKVIIVLTRKQLLKRWHYRDTEYNISYSGYAVKPTFRSKTRARLTVKDALLLMNDYTPLAEKWDTYFNIISNIARVSSSSEYTISFNEFLRRYQKTIVEQIGDWYEKVPYDELNAIFDNFKFIASIYDMVIHTSDINKAIIDFTIMLTLDSANNYGVEPIF